MYNTYYKKLNAVCLKHSQILEAREEVLSGQVGEVECKLGMRMCMSCLGHG